MLDVAPKDVVDTDAGSMLPVWAGKGDESRETPIPSLLAERVETITQPRSEPDDAPLIPSPLTPR